MAEFIAVSVSESCIVTMKRAFLKKSKGARTASSGATQPHKPSRAQKIDTGGGGNGSNRLDKNTKRKDMPKGPSPRVNSSYGVVTKAGADDLDGSEIAQTDCMVAKPGEVDQRDEATIHITIPIMWNDLALHSEEERIDSWCEAIMDIATKRHIFSKPGFPKPVSHPPHPLHCVASARDKGLGVFATRDIKEGELILAERAILMVPANVPSAGVYLPGHFTIEELLQERMNLWEKKLQSFVDRMLPERRATLMALANSNKHDGSGPILGRIRTNGFGGNSQWTWRGDGEPSGRYTLVYDQISRLNHSCRPNAAYTFYDASFSMGVHAVRDIAAGEEILISYVLLCHPYEERKAQLAPYGIDCKCDACVGHIISDARRARILPYISPDLAAPLAPQIGRYRSQIAILEQEGLQAMDLYLSSHMGLTVLYAVFGDKSKVEELGNRMERLSKRTNQDGKSWSENMMTLMCATYSSLLR